LPFPDGEIEVSDNYFEMASPSAVIWPIGVSSPHASPSTSSGNIFSNVEFCTRIDNSNLYDQLKVLEYVNNTGLNMQDPNTTNAKASGIWADGVASQRLKNAFR
jgi:hypothetical protein